jgi:hypothetical protein
MNYAEILAELPKLKVEERQELLERLWQLQDQDLLRGPGPTEGEKRLVDEELRQFEQDGDEGRPWEEVRRELLSRSSLGNKKDRR